MSLSGDITTLQGEVDTVATTLATQLSTLQGYMASLATLEVELAAAQVAGTATPANADDVARVGVQLRGMIVNLIDAMAQYNNAPRLQ